MWKAVLIATCLLVSLAVPAEGNPTFGVKLCGREFIRAVIFTCGGSRWRRASGPGDPSQDVFSLHDDEATDSWIPESVFSLPYPPPGEAELAGWGREEAERGPFSRLPRSGVTGEVLEALRTSRKGRDVVVGLSNACCKWGCNKSEISSLC